MLPKSRILLLATLAGLACLTGCVERRITIGSDPPGAVVWVDDVEVGRTPVTIPFQWYGDYDLRFRADKNVGTPEKPDIRHYELHTNMETKTPWFEWLGVDLVTEVSPGDFKDHQVWAFQIPEVPKSTDAELVKHATELKSELDKEKSRVNK